MLFPIYSLLILTDTVWLSSPLFFFEELVLGFSRDIDFAYFS